LLQEALKDAAGPFLLRLKAVLKDQSKRRNQNGTDVVSLLYQLSDILGFYTRRFTDLLGENASLCETFREAHKDTVKSFYDAIKERNEIMARKPPVPPSDLSPPRELHTLMNTLRDILGIFTASLVPLTEREDELNKITLSAILDPTEEMCVAGARSQGLERVEESVYLINCVTLFISTLDKFSDVVSVKIEMLKSSINVYLNQVVGIATASILGSCGLASKISLIKFAKSQKQDDPDSQSIPFASQPGMSPSAIASSLRTFEAFLLDLSPLSMSNISKIQDTTYRQMAQRMVGNKIAEAYEMIYKFVQQEGSYENASELFRYKPEQVRVMVIM